MVSSSGLVAPVGADSAGGAVDWGRWECCPHAARDINNSNDTTAGAPLNRDFRMSGRDSCLYEGTPPGSVISPFTSSRFSKVARQMLRRTCPSAQLSQPSPHAGL